MRARVERNDSVLTDMLVRCGQWNLAHVHATSSSGLVREAVLSAQFDLVIALLGPLNERHELIQNWDRGGNIFLAYALFKRKLAQLDSNNPGDIIDCRKRAAELCNSIRVLQAADPRDR